MITEDYVSFETAKLLKEKGFQAKCTACYHSGPSHTFQLVSGRINYCNPKFSKYKMIPPYNAPTLQMAMKWLREKGFIISPIPDFRFNKLLYINLIINTNSDSQQLASELYNTYEEACEAAIKYCLENLI